MTKRAPTTPVAPGPREYWRGPGERTDSPAARAEVEREFPAGAGELDGTSRREFIQLMGASLALAGVGTLAAGCTDPPDDAVPYGIKPEDVTPGKPLHYASALAVGGYATGVLVTTWEGRPTKIEGNPDHPVSRGTTGAAEQNAILGLYDPDRARVLKHKGAGATWVEFCRTLAAHVEAHKSDGGTGVAFLLEPNASPLEASLVKRLQTVLPKARFYGHDVGGAEAVYEGTRIAFGKPLEPQYDLTKARVVVALDSDFLSEPATKLHVARQFADRRAPGADMGRLYVAEAHLSITGGMADHRLRVRTGDVAELARALHGAVTGSGGGNVGGAKAQAWLKAVAKDLQAAGAEALVLAGPRQPAAVHALAHAINAHLKSGAVGYTAPVLPSYEPIATLAAELAGGRVDTLIVTAWNPAYSASHLDFGALLGKVPTSVYWTLYEDETAPSATWLIPAAHALEAWGDARSVDGTVSLVQPAITPLYDGHSASELLAALLGDGGLGGYRLLRQSYKQDDFAFARLLQKGLLDGTALGRESVTVDGAAVAKAAQSLTAPAAGLELNLILDGKVLDGRYANSGWMQELPDAITKLTWDNALLVAPATAKRLGVELNDLVEVKASGRAVTVPVLVQPGHADDSVTLALGYGRAGSAEETARHVGVDAYRLRSTKEPWAVAGVSVAKVSGRARLAMTQEHWSMENRPLALELPNQALQRRRLKVVTDKPEKEDAEAFEALEENRAETESLYQAHHYPGFKWGMGIDLNRCTGCSACITACQAENNTPVVGPDAVAKSREMHWLRLDRYYNGSEDEPTMVTQPVACVHCEKAPCEYVCPVSATVHSDEGLNDMVYNRCIGTRYCSNNCPYKVRRYNFLDYHRDVQPVARMAMNPDVTVRSRGVMEKCSYCVQRIERARIDARVAGRALADGEFTTACAQVCPTRAIVFGSLHDDSTEVSKWHADARSYQLLNDLGTRPRTAHLARVKNKNPELKDG